MEKAAENAPLFLEAFYDACENLRQNFSEYTIPPISKMNEICKKHGVGYEIRPPVLRLREEASPLIPVTEHPPTFSVQVLELYQASLKRSEELLYEGRGREAVQELLWLLETVATAFRSLETQGGKIEGKYFNAIVRELKKFYPGNTLGRVSEWVQSLHGYLSSPTGGGVRHGLDLREGIAINLSEARLFCNLIRSYLEFLLAAHKRLTIKSPR